MNPPQYSDNEWTCAYEIYLVMINGTTLKIENSDNLSLFSFDLSTHKSPHIKNIDRLILLLKSTWNGEEHPLYATKSINILETHDGNVLEIKFAYQNADLGNVEESFQMTKIERSDYEKMKRIHELESARRDKQFSEMTEKITELTVHNNELTVNLASVQEQNTKLLKQVVEMTLTSATLFTDVKNLQQCVTLMNKQYEELKQTVAAIQSKLPAETPPAT
jgi:vacuolar-type H+-ATPase subunit I/STV1